MQIVSSSLYKIFYGVTDVWRVTILAGRDPSVLESLAFGSGVVYSHVYRRNYSVVKIS